MYRYIITKQEWSGKQYYISALFDENKKMIEVFPIPVDSAPLLGNIYIGRVENIVSNLNAAFVKISPSQTCYLPLEDLKHPIFTKKQSQKKKLCAGDELIVQVSREALKTKEPSVTTNLSFDGRYAVVTSGNHKCSVSSKLSKELRSHYRELLEEHQSALKDCGVIIRTNASTAQDEDVLTELKALLQAYRSLVSNAQHMTAYSVLKKALCPYLKDLEDLPQSTLEQVVTDDREIFEKICGFYGIGTECLTSGGSVPSLRNEISTDSGILLRYYNDDAYSLHALYSIKENLRAALSQKVWLKSGAYLIIQPTEALTVIDVNTGKNVAKKDTQENFLRVNKDAAAEIARQLRLRNLSGIILIDFINLTSKEAEQELMTYLRACLKSDPVPVQLIDITKLGLVELTRKKRRKPLRESFLPCQSFAPVAGGHDDACT